MAQQFKTSQGITTVTVVKPKSEPKAPKTKKEKSQKIEQSSGIVITAVLNSFAGIEYPSVDANMED